MAQRILAPTTAAAFTTPFVVQTERVVTAIQTGLAGAELAALEISPDSGQTRIAVLIAGVAPNLNVANPSRRVEDVGLYRYNKGASVAAAAIYVATEENQ